MHPKECSRGRLLAAAQRKELLDLVHSAQPNCIEARSGRYRYVGMKCRSPIRA